jgi:chaperonin GroEL (HSP60 family)
MQSAAEAAEMILRIDDMIASSGAGEPDMGDMEGMGGMPGGMPPMM